MKAEDIDYKFDALKCIRNQRNKIATIGGGSIHKYPFKIDEDYQFFIAIVTNYKNLVTSYNAVMQFRSPTWVLWD